MTSNIQPFLVEDSRLFITDQLKFGVCKGPSQVQTYTQPANPPSFTTSGNFNILVPSIDTVVSNSIFLEHVIGLKCTLSAAGANPAVGNQIIQYGKNLCFCPYPLQRSCTYSSCTINSSLVSVNSYQQFDVISRTQNSMFQSKSGFAAACLDNYGSYADSIDATNSPFLSYESDQQLGSRASGRGCIPLLYMSTVGPTEGDFNFVDNAGGVTTFYIGARFREQVMLSPFNFNADTDKRGIRGLTTLNFVFQLNSIKNRILSNGITGRTLTVETMTVSDAKMYLEFLQPQPSMLSRYPSACVLPYYNLIDYEQNFTLAGSTYTMNFSAQNVNTVPDRLFIAIREKQLQEYKVEDSDHFLPIDTVSISFNNVPNILSTASKVQLYEMTVFNGVYQTWHQFNGISTKSKIVANPGTTSNIETCGPVLCLNFFSDIFQTNEYTASSAIGSYNIQVQVTGTLLTARASVTAQGIMIFQRSGWLKLDNGVSSEMIGVLSREDVLRISTQQVEYHSDDVRRMIGGGFFDTLRNIVSKVLPIAQQLAPVASNLLQQSGNKNLQTAGNLLSMIPQAGAGYSGGAYSGLGMSGLGMSGGKKRGHKLL